MSDISEKVQIRSADPREAAAKALLEASHAYLDSLFPPESCHRLPISALCQPHIRFFAADIGGVMRGCGALAVCDGYGEIKSMFVDPAARGCGIASKVLEQLEAEARGLSLPLLRLETGHSLDAALRLYARHGFTRCGPFGDYREDPLSVFMEKPL